MTNPLNQVTQAIIKDPHGKVARHASHWLAVNVMGWNVDLGFQDKAYYLKSDFHADIEGNEETVRSFIMYIDDWRPLTDANHTYDLVVHYCSNFGHVVGLKPYGKDRTHDARVILNDAHEYNEMITNDTVKGWLEND